MSSDDEDTMGIDHYIWEAHYVSYAEEGQQGTLFATSKEVAASRILSDCNLTGREGEWEVIDSHKIQFRSSRSPYHIITVVRRAVYGD